MAESRVEVAPPLTVGPLTLTDIVRYQGAAGDFNAIHHDTERAVRAGLGGVIAPGMYSAGLLSSWLLGWVPRRSVRTFAARFKTPVKVGDTLTISGEIVANANANANANADVATDVAELADGTPIRVEMVCTVGDGRVVTSAHADVLLP
jgi:3-hydroxybutyryl-CoA dehydratase